MVQTEIFPKNLEKLEKNELVPQFLSYSAFEYKL